MNNEKHKKNKLALRIIGCILLTIGIVLAIIGFVNFGNFENHLFGCAMAGLPLIAIGASLILFSFQKEINTYVKNESVPVFNEMSSEIHSGVSNITKAVKNGIDDENITCVCGEINPQNAQYCSKCGKQLHNTCKFCGAKVTLNDNFCNNCGKNLKDDNE